jgi:hypothetical protein
MTALKMIFKTAYLEEILDSKQHYISKMYKSLKNQIREKIKETELINVSLEKNLLKYEEKVKSLETKQDIVESDRINKSILENVINYLSRKNQIFF